MKFVRIANDAAVLFAVEAPDGRLHRLNNAAGDPADYLALYERAQAARQTVSAYTAPRLAAASVLPWALADLDVTPDPGRPHLLLPYVPPEAWGAAFTYPARPGAADPYADVRTAGRPVVFFKATPHRCVGPNDAVGSRADTTAMIPEPELGVVLDSAGGVIGYTAANDVSSRDLPAQNPLYICYSKTFDRCLSLGPAVVPPEALPEAARLDVRCRVTRGGEVLWDETGNTGQMLRSLDELVRHTVAHNRVPLGTLLATGTVLSPPRGLHITDGDLLEVFIPGIGRLANPVITV